MSRTHKVAYVGPLLLTFSWGRDAEFEDFDIFQCLLWVDRFSDHVGFRLTVCNVSAHIRWDYDR